MANEVRFKDSKVLFDTNKVAMHADCCCGDLADCFANCTQPDCTITVANPVPEEVCNGTINGTYVTEGCDTGGCTDPEGDTIDWLIWGNEGIWVLRIGRIRTTGQVYAAFDDGCAEYSSSSIPTCAGPSALESRRWKNISVSCGSGDVLTGNFTLNGIDLCADCTDGTVTVTLNT